MLSKTKQNIPLKIVLMQGFNGADMRNICTEAGMLAIRAERDYVVPNDFINVSKFLLNVMFLSFDNLLQSPSYDQY